MQVITSHEGHIQDIRNIISREQSRLAYLNRCKNGEQKWNLSKSELTSDIAFTKGKISAMEECLEMAVAFQCHS